MTRVLAKTALICHHEQQANQRALKTPQVIDFGAFPNSSPTDARPHHLHEAAATTRTTLSTGTAIETGVTSAVRPIWVRELSTPGRRGDRQR